MNQKIINLISKLKNKQIHIVGLSSSEACAITLFLTKFEIDPKNITAHDFSKTEEEFVKSFNINHVAYSQEERESRLKKIKDLNLKINFKDTYLHGIMDAKIIFVSQNWFNYPANFPLLKEALDKKIAFANITELYFSLSPCKIIGITGSNGKTTSSNLVYEILKQTKKQVFYTGNDRYSKQILEELDLMQPEDLLVMEISNRQLIDIKYSPYISVITNVLPNHIEEHGSFENYIQIKFNIFIHQTKNDYAVVNYDNSITREFLPKIKSIIYPFSRKEVFKDNGIYEKNKEIFMVSGGIVINICKIEDIRLVGEHNIENVLAAIGATFLAGISPEQIKQGIKNFKGVKNRIEFIRSVNNVFYYNDLASTTPQATVAALRSLNNNIILIAGGHDKGMDYNELASEIKLRVKKLILLPGRGTDKLIQALSNVNYLQCTSLKEAMDIVIKETKAGDSVLLSPACANFFSLYVNDKEGFNKLVKKIRIS